MRNSGPSNSASSAGPALRRGVPADIGAIMAIERGLGFEALVARSERAEHEAMLADRDCGYFVGVAAGGAVVAFAILRDLADPHGNVYLKRIAVGEPGAGVGGAFLRRLTDWVFLETRAHRFWLSGFAENARALHVYEKIGFRRDGRLREAFLAPDGQRRDLTMMALLRPEWEAGRSGDPDRR